ncbi:cupin domain-containing protein [Clostridium coskatii]|uniref:Ethanolamine utilization protein EutQ n=1 Tax=Clostridium coskatii TaxID=1705578 RepID=A0A168LGM2_9CLOT|nr:cupin domain-containing protein [Clostridium coskatii]OAA83129.1 Ethanolamine utilization protein EutQ [Clostridium coskatii]OBR90522.1 ethanolamine utilization protein EutQ [Clostridium coskatii]
MKKLICAKDVETAERQGQKVVYIGCEAIITPSAKDIAKSYGIEFSIEKQVLEAKSSCEVETPCETKTSELEKVFENGIDSEVIYKVFKIMMKKGLLNGMIDLITNKKPYLAETDSIGLKIVRGSSVKYEALDTGNPDDKVFYQEIINADDGSSMNAGFITIESCKFDWETECQELYYVIEGTLTVTVDNKVYTAHPGDSVFFPKGAKIAFGSPDKMKAFYATY